MFSYLALSLLLSFIDLDLKGVGVAGLPTIIRADGDSVGTYSLFNRILGGEAVETPDCSHPEFGPHITQSIDPELGVNVFNFIGHVEQDSDRCQVMDRSRIEIKTYGQSPPYLLGYYGETLKYSWDLYIPPGFQVTNAFTSLHQLKYYGGNEAFPVISHNFFHYTNGIRVMDVRYVGDVDVIDPILVTDLDVLLGKWMHVEERIHLHENGSYYLRISRLDDGAELALLDKKEISMWRVGGTEFCRPKWGLYRSLQFPEELRDEVIKMNNFCLAKGEDNCP